MTTITLVLAQAPQDCFLTGLCGIGPERVGPPPGLMYLALGLVLAGAFGLVRLWRQPTDRP